MNFKKIKKPLFNVLLTVIGLIFVLSLLKVDEFKGNLENYDTFSIIDSSDSYDLLRVLNNIDSTTSLALYSSDTSLQYDFYDEDILIYSISDNLLENEYIVFNLESSIGQNIRLEVYDSTNLIDEVTFYYTNDFNSIEYIIINEIDYDSLLLQDNIENRSIIILLLNSDFINPLVVIGMFVFMLVIVLLPYKKISEYLFSKKARAFFQVVFIHTFISVILFGLTLFAFVKFFEDSEESTSTYDNADYIYEETTEFKVDVSIGIQESFWINGSTVETVYRLKLVTFDNNLDYTGIFVCGNETFGFVSSIEGSDFSYDQVREVFLDGKCETSNSFYIKVVDTKTGVLVYQTEDYFLYKTLEETVATFDLVQDTNGKVVVLGIFLFHFIFTATLIDLLILHIDKKEIFPLIKPDKHDINM